MAHNNLVKNKRLGSLRKRSQQGFTLMEVLLSVSIGSLILASGARFMNDRVDDIRDQNTAQYQKMVTIAAERYLKDNLAAEAATLAVDGPPKAIPLATLRTANYLPSGIVAQNPYAQVPCIVVRRLSDRPNGDPRLEALITTEGGNPIPERRTPFIAAQGGAYGGFVPAAAPTTAQGAFGVWTTDLNDFNTVSCSGTPVAANKLAFALYFDGASSGNINPDDLLHRNAVPGRPDLNTMNTHLNMGAFDINNAQNITASGTVSGGIVRATSDDPALYGQTDLRRWGLNNPTHGINIQTGPGQALTLQSNGGVGDGTLQSNYGRNEFMSGHTQFSREGTIESAPSTIGVAENTSVTGTRATINFNNAGVAQGALELTSSAVSEGINPANRTGDFRRLRLYDPSSGIMGLELTGDLLLPSAGNITGRGRMHIDGPENLYLQPWRGQTVVGGGGGQGNLTLARDGITAGTGTGNLYVGAVNAWLTERLPNFQHKWSFKVGNGMTLSKPACASGGIAKVIMTPMQWQIPYDTTATGAVYFANRAINYSTYWYFVVGAYWPGYGFTSTNFQSIAMIYCSYP